MAICFSQPPYVKIFRSTLVPGDRSPLQKCNMFQGSGGGNYGQFVFRTSGCQNFEKCPPNVTKILKNTIRNSRKYWKTHCWGKKVPFRKFDGVGKDANKHLRVQKGQHKKPEKTWKFQDWKCIRNTQNLFYQGARSMCKRIAMLVALRGLKFFRTYAKICHPGAKALLNKIYQDTQW